MGRDDDDKKAGNSAQDLAVAYLGELASNFPLIGPVYNAVESGYEGFSGSSNSFTPSGKTLQDLSIAFSSIGKAAKESGEIYDSGKHEGQRKDVVQLTNAASKGAKSLASMLGVPDVFGRVVSSAYFHTTKTGDRSYMAKEAAKALDAGDRAKAESLVKQYNDKKPAEASILTIKQIKDSNKGKRLAAKNEVRDLAARYLLNGDAKKARELIDEYNKSESIDVRKIHWAFVEIAKQKLSRQGVKPN